MQTLQQIITTLTTLVVTLSGQVGNLPSTAQLAQVAAPTSGLVGYWNFDESSGSTVADSAGGNSGTLTNGATLVSGKLNNAVSFDGVNDYVSLPNFDVSGAGITITTWIKADAFPSSIDARFVSKANSSSQDGHWWMLGQTPSGGDKLRFRLKTGGSTATLIASSGNLSLNTWTHVAATYDGSNMRLYKDGVEVGNMAKSGSINTDGSVPVNFGRNGDGSNPFDGSLDEVRIYNRALSVSEIQDVMNDGGSTTPPPPPPPSDTTAPSVPSGLSANAVSSFQINLSWNSSTDNVAVTGYDIYRGGTLLTSVSGTSYSDTGLAASAQYSYTVRAKDAAGNTSSQSSSVSAITQAGTTPPPPPPPSGTTFYIRDGGTSSSCTDWTNACDTLPATLQRGATYYVADGSYGSYTFDDAESGTSLITIKKATISDHGTNTGWSSTYGDGQATFSDMLMLDDYYVIDGQTRNESNWQDTASYGFRNTGSVTIHTLNYGRGSNNITFRYIDVGGPVGDTFSTSLPSYGFYFGGFGQVVSNWTISKSHVHNVYLPFQIAGADNIAIEYSWIGPNWSKETIRGQIRASNIVIRHNILKDGCQGTPGDPTAGGCTGQIAMWDGNAGAFDGSKIYGNLIWTTKTTHHSDAVIMIGGDGNVTAAGAAANNVLVYNNTIAGIQSGQATIRFPGSHTGDIAQNNIWYGLGSSVNTGCSANTCTNNVVIPSASQFLNAAGGNFRLASATQNGTSLSSPYNIDMDNRTRGSDGVWDLGAYEFTGGTTPPPTDTTAPSTPTNLSASAISSSQVNLSWSASTDNVGVTGYRIERCPGSTCSNYSQIATPSGTSFNDTGLTPNTTYRYRVRAVDAASNLSSYSTIVNGTTQTSAPIIGDFNNDGLVNSIDLSLLTSRWNQNYPAYDLNSDGIINSLDYAIMVQNWSL